MRTSLVLIAGLTASLMACGGNKATTTNHFVAPTFDWSNSDMVPGKILVDLKDNVSDSDVRDLEAKTGLVFSEANEVAHEYRFEDANVAVADEATMLEVLNGDDRVEHAEPIVKYHALFTPNDPLYDKQWGMKRINLDSSLNMDCGQGVRIASVDTGVACYEGKGMKPLSDLAVCSGGFNVFDNSPIAIDRQSHGSHTAGTMAQLTNNGIGTAGIAPCATIIPVKVLDDNGSGSNETVAEGIRWAADHADIMNLSLGGPSPSKVIEDAVNYAHDKGVPVICAAGNSGGAIGYPARFPNAIAVSAIGPDDKIADFSSRGPQIAIAAPGVNIYQSTIDDNGNEVFVAYSGTSMATPMVSGVAALLVAQGITNPDAIRSQLQATADPKDNKNLYGAGILRADSAVRSTIFSHLIYRLLALMGILFLLRKAIGSQWKNKLTLTGIVVGGFGAVPLFFTGLLPRLGSFRIVGELLARPLGEWDIALGHGHSLLLLASAIPTAIASVLMLGHNKLKYLAGGLGLGAMALEAQIAYSNESNFVFGSIGMRVFMALNMLVIAYFVKSIFTSKTTTA